MGPPVVRLLHLASEPVAAFFQPPLAPVSYARLGAPCFNLGLLCWQDFGESRYGGEPIFVPKSQDAEEGEGFLIVLVCESRGVWGCARPDCFPLLCTGGRPTTTNDVAEKGKARSIMRSWRFASGLGKTLCRPRLLDNGLVA